MRSLTIVFFFFLGAVTAVPAGQGRIAGGSITTINQYPFVASTLFSRNNVVWVQSCTGAIINNRALLSSANCYLGDPVNRWRIRVGSSYANSGGVVHNVYTIVIHNNYNSITRDNDIAIVRSSTTFTYNNNVAYIPLAGANYNIPDNSAVWALGWGRTTQTAAPSEQLRRVQVWTVNANVCRNNYLEVGFTVTNNMLCSGWVNQGGRGQCEGDDGGPLIHNNNLVGVFSWGQQCASSRYPDINTKVSPYITWIRNNA
ncbi:unnamed protein product [Leptosia nina]|uniref:Peptidase S1 domain-containing protein n=1 Tax=Leptosia nina TaxID=320188 RepID=A0AAV1IVU1_9NEOP